MKQLLAKLPTATVRQHNLVVIGQRQRASTQERVNLIVVGRAHIIVQRSSFNVHRLDGALPFETCSVGSRGSASLPCAYNGSRRSASLAPKRVPTVTTHQPQLPFQPASEGPDAFRRHNKRRMLLRPKPLLRPEDDAGCTPCQRQGNRAAF